MARFRPLLLFVCFTSCCIGTCIPCLASPPTVIIDEKGHSLASLFDGLLAGALHDPPRQRPRLQSVRCVGSVRKGDGPALVENGRVAAPCPNPTACSGNCICMEPIGPACCGVEVYNFYFNCGACQGGGDEDVYVECPNGTCCWSAYPCRPGG